MDHRHFAGGDTIAGEVLGDAGQGGLRCGVVADGVPWVVIGRLEQKARLQRVPSIIFKLLEQEDELSRQQLKQEIKLIPYIEPKINNPVIHIRG